jgi:hypothetical protein
LVAVAGVGQYKRSGGEIVKSKLVEQTVFRRAVRKLKMGYNPGGFALCTLAQRAPSSVGARRPTTVAMFVARSSGRQVAGRNEKGAA